MISIETEPPLRRTCYRTSQTNAIDEKRWIREIITRGGYCHICGYHDDPRIIEMHHIAGRRNSPIVIPVCPNCHQHLSLKQRSWPRIWMAPNNAPRIKIALIEIGRLEIEQQSDNAMRQQIEQLHPEEGEHDGRR